MATSVPPTTTEHLTLPGYDPTFTHIETATGGTSTPGVSCTIIGYEYVL